MLNWLPLLGHPGNNLMGRLRSSFNDDYVELVSAGDLRFGVPATNKFEFNPDGLDTDFRILGNNDQNLFFVDAGTDRVGIGTGFPQSLFHASGVITTNNYLDMQEISAPATPNPNFFRTYPKADGKLYGKNDDGTEYDLTAGGDLSAAWPIGSIYIAVVSTNPATLLGFGTWIAFAEGRVLVGLQGADPDFNTVEETGGAKSITLTEEEMPSHTHVQDAHNHTQNQHRHTSSLHDHNSFSASKYTVQQAGSGGNYTFDSGGTTLGIKTGTGGVITNYTTPTNVAATAVNQSTGGGAGSDHDNVQPYIVVYMWKRTA